MIQNFNAWKESKQINEAEGQTYDYGCAMLYFNMPQMQQLHESIAQEDIFTKEGDRSFGLETEPHVTLLYGLHHDVDHDAVTDTCQNCAYPNLTLKNASCFNNDEYDVLKFDVDSPELHSVNAELSKFPHTTNFPDYHPHSTVAYLKKGTGQKYVDKFKDQEHQVTPNKIVYSMASGEKREYPII